MKKNIGKIVSEFEHIVRVDNVAPSGQHFKLDANEEQISALEKRLGLNKLYNFSAEIDIHPVNKRKFKVSGIAYGKISQICSVSLNPFDDEVKAEFSLVYQEEIEAMNTNLKEIEVSFEDEEIEDLIDRQIDIGELAVQYFSLEIDPFPRAKGAVFEDRIAPFEKENPFKVLEKLKKS
ncbi:MAG: DUF177 domain-containing protein [Alphaproteobacteria bacterium]|nr:DUF177 domain-containing protein [Alphaproteobacteria bacterium]